MPPTNQVKTLLAPLGGINRRTGFQQQPPFTCVDVENWWPINYRTGRSVMATRPLRRVLESPAGGGALTVNMMEKVNGDTGTVGPIEGVIVAEDGDVYYWNGSGWTAATGAQAGSIATSGYIAAQVFLKKVLIQNDSGKPYVFDYDDGTVVTMTETAGTVPDGLDIFAVWQGAVWAAGTGTASPNVLYASRIGDALDWDFSVGANDLGGAFFTAGENQGLLRGNITAIIPHSSDTLIVGTTEGMVAIYGHPRKGGIIEDFSSRRIVGSRAWCKGPDDTTYIITDEGLVAIPPGSAQTGVVPVSQSKLPGALSTQVSELNTTLGTLVNMAYDRAFNGLHIYTSSGSGFWYDINSQGFWRMSFPNVLGMLEDAPVSLDIDGTTIVYGSAGMQAFDDTIEATESFAATCFIGPVKLASSILTKSIVTQARVVMDVAGSGMSLSLAAGTSGQDAFNRANAGNSQFTRAVGITTNVNHDFWPRVTGNALVARLRVDSVTRTPAIFEELAIGTSPRGRNRGSSQPPPL